MIQTIRILVSLLIITLMPLSYAAIAITTNPSGQNSTTTNSNTSSPTGNEVKTVIGTTSGNFTTTGTDSQGNPVENTGNQATTPGTETSPLTTPTGTVTTPTGTVTTPTGTVTTP
ncbi:hypothetical protein Ljor_0290, partial [Legionella jordanis]